MSCTRACVTPSPAQAHCGVCHETFGGVRLFDTHRKTGTCIAPATLGAVARNGVWRVPAEPGAFSFARGADLEGSDDE